MSDTAVIISALFGLVSIFAGLFCRSFLTAVKVGGGLGLLYAVVIVLLWVQAGTAQAFGLTGGGIYVVSAVVLLTLQAIAGHLIRRVVAWLASLFRSSRT